MAKIPFLTYNTGDVVKDIISVIPEFVNDDFDLGKWVQSLKYGLSNRKMLTDRMDGLYDFDSLKNNCYKKCQKMYTNIQNS